MSSEAQQPPPEVTSWADAPIVEVVAPACPYCQSEHYQRSKTLSGGDGSRTKRVNCRDCGERYIILIEPSPETGENIIWPATISRAD